MARGWESKSVEDQQADREQSRPAGAKVTAEEAARHAQRRTLEVTRARTLADLAVARSPAHRGMLEAALKALDDQLAPPQTQGATPQQDSQLAVDVCPRCSESVNLALIKGCLRCMNCGFKWDCNGW